MKKLITLLMTAVLAVLTLTLTPTTSADQIADRRLNNGKAAQAFNLVTIYASTNSGNPTSAWQVIDLTGTNYLRVNPTNALLTYRTGGILWTGVTGTLTFNGSNAIITGFPLGSNLTFVNGLLLGH